MALTRDPTTLNAAERDLLVLLAGYMEKHPDEPAELSQFRQYAAAHSERFASEGSGNFYVVKGNLIDAGYVTEKLHPTDGRTKLIGLTIDGEEMLTELAEMTVAHAKGVVL